MNYVAEINAIHDHDLVNQLNPSALLLYLALLHTANRLYWPEDFEVSAVTLQARSGIRDRKTLERARRALVERGLILYRPGIRTGGSGTYTVLGLAETGEKTRGRPAGTGSPGAAVPGKGTGTAELLVPPGGQASGNDSRIAGGLPGNPGEGAGNDSPDIYPFPPPAGNDSGNDSAETVPAGSPKARSAGVSMTRKTNQSNQTGNQFSSAPADEASGPPVNNRQLIAELVEAYRRIEGIVPVKGDYPFIGSLYNEFGYERVLSAIHELGLAAVTTRLEKPLIYLKAILKRASPPALKVLPGAKTKEEEEDPLERYRREQYRG